jgi:hypothetical protein
MAGIPERIARIFAALSHYCSQVEPLNEPPAICAKVHFARNNTGAARIEGAWVLPIEYACDLRLKIAPAGLMPTVTIDCRRVAHILAAYTAIFALLIDRASARWILTDVSFVIVSHCRSSWESLSLRMTGSIRCSAACQRFSHGPGLALSYALSSSQMLYFAYPTLIRLGEQALCNDARDWQNEFQYHDKTDQNPAANDDTDH